MSDIEPSRASPWRLLFFLGSLGLIVLAMWLVPLPLLVLAPTPATPVADVIRVTGAVDQPTGQLMLTTVALKDATALRVLDALLLDSHEDLVRRGDLLPEGVDQEQYFEQQRKLFEESIQVAAAVGLRLAGRTVLVDGQGARVVDVVPGSAADGRLRAGDVIVGVDGTRVHLASELATRTRQASAGQQLTLDVQRDGATSPVTVTATPIPGQQTVGLGVQVVTVDQRISMPEGTGVSETEAARIGGPSAGLMFALTVYDMFEPSDLTRGRRIAGTGEVDLQGNVGQIGGIQEKVRGAQLANATVFLAPARQARDAANVAPPGMEVIPVATVQEAIEALRR